MTWRDDPDTIDADLKRRRIDDVRRRKRMIWPTCWGPVPKEIDDAWKQRYGRYQSDFPGAPAALAHAIERENWERRLPLSTRRAAA